MNYLKIIIFVLGITFVGCKNEPKMVLENIPEIEHSKDKEEIEKLIKDVLNWSWANPGEEKGINLLPILTDEKDSICIGFNFEKHKSNLKTLKETEFFDQEFIENYNQIIITLDKKIKSKEVEWEMGMLPTFNFSSDVNVWCKCQDVPYDKPNPFDLIEVTEIKIDNEKGEMVWNWGNNGDPNWEKSELSKEPNYKFRVTKVNGKWKISYLELFDYETSTL